jgi:hypothetical protein
MSSPFGIDATQIAGVLAFAAAALACAVAAVGARGNAPTLWRVLALFFGVVAIEVVAGLRYQAHDWVTTMLQHGGVYPQRASLQRVLIALAAGLLVAGVALICALRTRGAALQVALAAGFCVVMFFALESISLHGIDAVLYRPVGPLRLIGWLWLCLAAGAIGAALRQRFSAAGAA